MTSGSGHNTSCTGTVPFESTLQHSRERVFSQQQVPLDRYTGQTPAHQWVARRMPL